MSTTALKIVLILFGLYGLFLAIDFGFGGFATLGWQGSTDFFRIVEQARYGVQDSHFRYLGGTFAAIGLFMIFAVSNLQKYQQALNFIFALIFLGGVMRLTSGNPEVIFSAEIAVALFAETVLMAVLYVWLRRETNARGMINAV